MIRHSQLQTETSILAARYDTNRFSAKRTRHLIGNGLNPQTRCNRTASSRRVRRLAMSNAWPTFLSLLGVDERHGLRPEVAAAVLPLVVGFGQDHAPPAG